MVKWAGGPGKGPVNYGNGRMSVPVPDLLIRPPRVLGQRMQLCSNTPERRAVIELSAGRPEIRMPADDSAVAGTVVRTRSLEPLAHAVGVVQGALGC
jgi:hypothetical protein